MNAQIERHLTHDSCSEVNQRFVNALKQSMITNRLSQRELCAEISITIGTLTKYLRGSISPFKVGLEIQENLAKTLGVSLTALSAYYKTGEYVSQVTIEDVTSWIRKESVQTDMPKILAAASASDAYSLPFAENVEVVHEDSLYTWPAEQLKAKNVSQKILTKLGLTGEVLEDLSHGKFDNDCVESFAWILDETAEDITAAFSAKAALG